MNNPLQWSTIKLKVKDLKDHSKNPRQISKDQLQSLQESIEKFNYVEIVAIDTDNTILAGHMRVKALKNLKRQNEEIEVRIPNRKLTDKERNEYLIRSNKNTGEWDFDILANEFDVPDLLEWGFTQEELSLGEIEDLGSTEEESEILEPADDKDAYTKLGDVYQLNDHRLVCDDSTLPDTVFSCLNGAEPTLMITDPPYGVEYDPKWRNDVKGAHKPIKAAGKVQNDDKINWALAWSLFPGNIAYIWHAGKYCSEVQQSLLDAEFEIVNQIIWMKQHFALSRGDYHWQHEPCWYAVRKGQSHNWQGARDQSTTWEIANLNCFGKSKEDGEERTAHSTQKPIECMARPIRNNTAKGESVYDPFLGSGTTLIAAEQLGRICYGIELSPAYCDIIIKRWIKYMEKNNKDYTLKKNGELIGKECLNQEKH